MVYNVMAEKKIVDQSIAVSRKKGNGIVRYEVWEENGKVSRYNLAYINHLIYSGDNGRVIGYDNKHGYHHRHLKGEVEPVDIQTYEEAEQRFKQDWAAVLEEYNGKRNR